MSGARAVPGAGEAHVATGVPLLDHLLTEFAQAARLDLTLEIDPDDAETEVDEAGMALGAALRDRLAPGCHGDATAAADEALAMVVVEGSGRARVVSNASLAGAGGLGTDLVARFLGAFAESAGLTIHVRLIEGSDSEHVLSAIFRALGVALARAGSDAQPA